jgi:hypothetical protein
MFFLPFFTKDSRRLWVECRKDRGKLKADFFPFVVGGWVKRHKYTTELMLSVRKEFKKTFRFLGETHRHEISYEHNEPISGFLKISIGFICAFSLSIYSFWSSILFFYED